MKKLISKINQAVQLVLVSPLKLPSKAMNILRYVALSLGILETVLNEDEAQQEVSTDESME